MSNSTATSRIFSASLANWVGIGVSLLTQIVFVPIFLSHWSAEIYGVWLLLLSFLGFAGLIQGAHRDFIYHESLKLGKNNLEQVCLQLSSALPLVVLSSFIVFLIVYFQFEYSIIDLSFGLDEALKEDFLFSAMMLALVLFVVGNYYGFLLGPVVLLGYYPFITWLKVGIAFFTSIVPVIVVMFDGQLTDAVIGLVASTFIAKLVAIFWVLRLYKKENIQLPKPNFKLGLMQFARSAWILAKYVSDTFRQTGIRFLITPFLGSAAVAQFATNRTIANVAQQGITSLVGPILPELMRYAHERKQVEVQATLALLWIMLCFVIAPGFIVLQLLIEPFFEVWTRGAIEFDSVLFVTLSSSILVMILAQPADSILRGNNLYKIQLSISVMALVCLVFIIYIFSNSLGVLAAGAGLFVSETLVLCLSVWKAQEWMQKRELRWPWQYFLLSLFSVGLTLIALILIAYEIEPFISAGVVLTLQFAVAIKFWQLMPSLAKEKAYRLLNKIGVRK